MPSTYGSVQVTHNDLQKKWKTPFLKPAMAAARERATPQTRISVANQ
jgi:hypothetical protein